MKISEQEVNRLLALFPAEPVLRTGDAEAEAKTRKRPELSADSPEVKRVTQLVHQLPDGREDRVQALKALIESGEYRVSGEDIADLIIRRTLADNTAL